LDYYYHRKGLERENENNMYELTANNPNPVLSIAKDGTVLYSNAAGEPLINEWNAKTGEKLPQSIIDLVQKVISCNIPEKMEVKVDKRIYLVAFHPVPEKEYVGIYGFDISNMKEFEEQLLDNEEQYRAIYENSIDAIFFTSPDDTILAANPAACEMFRMSEEEIIQIGLNGIQDPSDLRLKHFLEERARTGKFKGELNYRRKDGTIFPGEISSVLFKDKNGVLRTANIIRDITERKLAEGMMHESETCLKVDQAVEAERRRLFDVLETLPIAISLLTANHHIAFANRVFRKKYDEVYGRYCPDFCFEFNKPCKFCEAYKVLETGKLHRWEATMPDGSILDVYNLPFTDIDGSPMVLEMDIDITERKKAEEKLREREEKYRDIVETSNEGIYFVNDEAIITYVNKTMELSGYTREEIVGRPIWDFISEECMPVAKQNFEKRRRGITDNYELKLVRKDGSFIWGVISAKPRFNKNGEFKGYLAMLTDITDRKKTEEKLRESEEKYRNIVETANEGILITDNENLITYINKKVIGTIGYSLEELVGRPIWSFISKEYRPIIKEHMVKRMQGISESYELKLIHKDGYSIWVFLNAKPFFNKEGKYIGSMSMFTDITKRKKAEEALKNIETARKKEIHHRIKNNLQVISSLLDLQAEQFKDRDCIKDSEVLEAFRDSQDRIVSMALIHEELYRGGGFETLNFVPYIEELAKNLFQSYNLGNADINLKLELTNNISFDMDIAVPLGMIINELVSNSFKHAFPNRDKGEIRIKLDREEEGKCIKKVCEDGESTTFILSVSDDGIGIPEYIEIKDLDSLGLQLVTSLVDQLDGKLELKRNNGTEFIVRFTIK
jgi:PAS domain S-box-containing protein